MQQSSQNVPIVSCVFPAWQFFLRNRYAVLRYGFAYVATGVLGAWLTVSGSDNAAFKGLGFLFTLASLVLFYAMDAALYRRAFDQPETGMFGLAFGADELRLFGTRLLITLVGGVVVTVLVVLFSIAIGGVLSSGFDPELLQEDASLAFREAGAKLWILLGGATIFILAVLVYLTARFSLAYPMAFIEQRIHIFEAAAWTKGQGLRIALVLCIAVLPFYLLLSPTFFSMGKELASVIRIISADFTADPALNPIHLSLFSRVFPLILAPAMAAVRVGLFYTLYRGLRPLQ